MASRLRYLIGVGLQYVSERVGAPNSTGKPPACHTPRLTCSARSRRCMWHGFSSDQVLMIAMMGLPACPAASTPICRIRDLWLNERRPVEPNHPALRSVSGVFICLPRGRSALGAWVIAGLLGLVRLAGLAAPLPPAR